MGCFDHPTRCEPQKAADAERVPTDCTDDGIWCDHPKRLAALRGAPQVAPQVASQVTPEAGLEGAPQVASQVASQAEFLMLRCINLVWLPNAWSLARSKQGVLTLVERLKSGSEIDVNCIILELRGKLPEAFLIAIKNDKSKKHEHEKEKHAEAMLTLFENIIERAPHEARFLVEEIAAWRNGQELFS